MLVETVIGALLQVAFDRIVPGGNVFKWISSFFKSKDDDGKAKEPFENLKMLLLSVKAVLGDAEEKQVVDPNVKAWIDMVREVIYDADDLLDKIATVDLQLKLNHGSRSNDAGLKLSSMLGEINNRLAFIVKLKDVLGLREGNGGKPSSPSIHTTSAIEDSEVYGRDGDRDKIIELLLSGNVKGERVSVVAIVGMAGIGKTTLSQLLFNDGGVKRHFGLRSWVYVAEGSDPFEVTKKVYESMTHSYTKIRGLNSLQAKIEKLIRNKRFLLVLDDFSCEGYIDWNLIKRPFTNAAHGSVFIVTTQNENVALAMRASITYLTPLQDEDCYKIFAHHAFRTREVNPVLGGVGKKIARKCKGHPLSAKALGSLLYSTENALEWDNVLQSKMWDLPTDKINILPALKLSYQYLPLHLKRCFAYCSILPKGREISKSILIFFWMAESLLPESRNGKTMEEAGKEYLRELISRSFLQRSDSSVIMHDLMSELAQHVADEVFHKLENGDPSYFPKRVRHLSFSQDMLDTPEKFEPFQELSQLRTFLPFRWPQSQQFNSPTDFDFLLRPLVRLRVLSLSNYAIRSVPKSIQGLKHLRFLNLSSTEIQRIPSFIGSLYNLQTLLLSKCHKLTTLPTNLTDLTKLRHLDVCGTKLTQMPPNFGGLKYLRLLTTFFVSKDNGSRINELGALLQLHGSLSIVKLENVIDGADASEAKLQEMKFLDELELIWTNHVHNLPSDEENVLGHLQPCKYLRKLKIENYGGKRFPNWLGIPSFSNIVSIHLIGCRNCSSLPQLGQLLSLEILHVAKMTRLESVNPDFYGNKNHTRPFRSLKIMSFEDMFEWKYWMPVDGAEFPSLEELKIEKCSRLTGDLSHNLPALNKLVISGCHALVDSLPKVPILQELEIIDCNSWNCLPAVLVQGTRLSKLILSKCQCLQSFPSASFPMLKSLHIDNCRSLELHLTEHSVHHFQKLEDLHLESSCNAVSILPLSFFPGLCNLHIEDSSNLRSLSISADAHQYLQCLEIINCPELVSLPVGGLLTPNLHSLSICGCENLSPLNEWGLHGMQSLVSLKINGNLGQVHSFPDEGLLPSQLASLHISRFEELISLDHAGLQHLTSLKHLEIHDCVKLGNLPAEGLPQSLWSLIIKNCPQLVGHCQMHTGQYWHLISGIEDLVIDK